MPSAHPSAPRRQTTERRRSRAAEHLLIPFKSLSGFSMRRSQNANGSKVKMFKGFENLCRLIRAGLEALLLLSPLTRSLKVSPRSSLPGPSCYFKVGARSDPRLEQSQGRQRTAHEGCTTHTQPGFEAQRAQAELSWSSPLPPQNNCPKSQKQRTFPQKPIFKVSSIPTQRICRAMNIPKFWSCLFCSKAKRKGKHTSE